MISFALSLVMNTLPPRKDRAQKSKKGKVSTREKVTARSETLSYKKEEDYSPDLKGLIQDLSLKEREFEVMHPAKSTAIERIMELGDRAVEPLLNALDNADEEARGWIIFLLGMLVDGRTLVPISTYVKANEERIRTGDGEALKAFELEIGRLIKENRQLDTRSDAEHPRPDGINHP
jgi:HEAT repeat protein